MLSHEFLPERYFLKLLQGVKDRFLGKKWLYITQKLCTLLVKAKRVWQLYNSFNFHYILSCLFTKKIVQLSNAFCFCCGKTNNSHRKKKSWNNFFFYFVTSEKTLISRNICQNCKICKANILWNHSKIMIDFTKYFCAF